MTFLISPLFAPVAGAAAAALMLMPARPGRNSSSAFSMPRVSLPELDTSRVRGFLVPATEAVATKAREVHQVDILYVGALFDQVFAKRAKSRGF